MADGPFTTVVLFCGAQVSYRNWWTEATLRNGGAVRIDGCLWIHSRFVSCPRHCMLFFPIIRSIYYYPSPQNYEQCTGCESVSVTTCRYWVENLSCRGFKESRSRRMPLTPRFQIHSVSHLHLVRVRFSQKLVRVHKIWQRNDGYKKI